MELGGGVDVDGAGVAHGAEQAVARDHVQGGAQVIHAPVPASLRGCGTASLSWRKASGWLAASMPQGAPPGRASR